MILTALICIAGTTAFFLFVPLLPVIGTGLIVFGFVLMFVAGVHVGYRSDCKTPAIMDRKLFPAPEQISDAPRLVRPQLAEYSASVKPGA